MAKVFYRSVSSIYIQSLILISPSLSEEIVLIFKSNNYTYVVATGCYGNQIFLQLIPSTSTWGPSLTTMQVTSYEYNKHGSKYQPYALVHYMHILPSPCTVVIGRPLQKISKFVRYGEGPRSITTSFMT